MIKRKTFIFVLLLATVFLMYELSNINSIVKPYVDFLFPKIKTEKQVGDFLLNNEKDIKEMVNSLILLPYEHIEIFSWLLLDDSTIVVDDAQVLVGDVIKGSDLFFEYFKAGKIKYIEKYNNAIYISTDTTRGYDQGIVYLEENSSPTSTNNIRIVSANKICKNYYFYRAK